MKILVFGASCQTSIGFMLSRNLPEHEFAFASRSGKLGYKCEVADSAAVSRLAQLFSPDVIIHSAGVFTKPEPLGDVSEWGKISQHLLAKSLGALIVLDVAVKFGIKTVVFLGGSTASPDPNFANFSIGNGAMLSAVKFASIHTNLMAVFVEVSAIKDSTMLRLYRADNGVRVGALAKVIKSILAGECKSGDVITLL